MLLTVVLDMLLVRVVTVVGSERHTATFGQIPVSGPAAKGPVMTSVGGAKLSVPWDPAP